MNIVVGAYAAADPAWSSKELFGFYAALGATSQISGLELPLSHVRAAIDRPELVRDLPEHWRHQITTLPHTMQRLAKCPTYGLASGDPAGRTAALSDVAHACHASAGLTELLGEAAVEAITLVSAPRTPAGSTQTVSTFADSLCTVAAQEWGCTSMLVEHCDAATSAHPPAKGFLPLASEMDAIDSVGRDAVRISVNWARSAIERHDAAAALEHVTAAASRGSLGALILSGCAAKPSDWGQPWADTHLPPAGVQPPGASAHESLMDHAGMVAVLQAAGPTPTVGVKVAARPRSASLAARLELVSRSVRAVADAIRTAHPPARRSR